MSAISWRVVVVVGSLVTSDLTASRLAQHNRTYAPLTTVQSRHDDVMSYTTTTTTVGIPRQ